MNKEDARINRRRFLKRSAWGVGLGMGWPILSDAMPADTSMSPVGRTRPTGTVLFQGDSITDAGRSKDEQPPNRAHALGGGYVGLAAAQLLAEHPGSGLQCYNRGISGNKVFQLDARWQEDCLELQPDILSILIGVNDFWHTLSNRYDGTVKVYEEDYRALLGRTKETLPDVELIIGEPFILDGGTAITEAWHPAFDAYRAAAKRVAEDYDAIWIPYQSMFDDALQQAPAAYWAPDGVHPAPAGSYLMAQAWLEAYAEATS